MTTPKLKAPTGACDTHMHIYDDRYPPAPTSVFKSPHAPVPDYREIQKQLRLERAVVVQPTGYGYDNRCTLEAVAALGPATRCVVVVGPAVKDAELEGLTRAGARGLRYHMLPGGVLGWESLETMAARINAYGWHIQLQLDGRNLSQHEPLLSRLPCDLVIDHNGKFLEPVATTHPGFQALLRLLDSGRRWVKLSAPYETSKTGPPHYADVGVLAKALVKANPERCLWASNWPHLNQNPRPSSALMLDLLLEWADDQATRRRILVDNPARLYGF